MDAWLADFKEIAPYLTHPLVLVGFVLLLFFGIHRTLLKAGIIPPLPADAGGKVVQILLRYGFVIALLVIVLGFGLQFYKTHRETQPPVDVAAIVERLEARHREELARVENRYESELGDWKKQATEAVGALANLRGTPNAPPGIDEALAMLERGQTKEAKAIFETIAQQKEADIKEAAAAYRHLGALAFLDDTERALAAYRRATELDPDNPQGWNQLGHLLLRVGRLDGAEAAYQEAKAIGEAKRHQSLIAIAYNNFGAIYATRGDLDQAEAMHEKSLAINEALGRKLGMAEAYGLLGAIYATRGDLDQAEAMHEKSLAINEALGRKLGMARQYNELGAIYATRGDLDQAEAMHEKSLAINEALGHKLGMAEAYGLLGTIYLSRDDLDQAEAMLKKSLAIEEALKRKAGMATAYGNLGLIYWFRGDLDQAEAMFKKSLALFQEVDAGHIAEIVEQWLASLHRGH